MKKSLLFLLPVCLCAAVAGHAQPLNPDGEPLHYWRQADAYLQDQADVIFRQSYKVLEAHPPTTEPGDERRLALFSLDALLHDVRLDDGAAFRSYMDRVVRGVEAGLKTPFPAGAKVRVFRLYNDGFIVQTPSVTIGIDIIRGGSVQNPFVTAGQLRPLVERCDVMFITHGHGDHADKEVARMFLEAGKEVIVPAELWKDLPAPLRVMRGSEGRSAVETVGKLRVNAWPGAQGDVLNNVYAITTPEGTTVMHTGDQDYTSDVGALGMKVDVLIVQSWMMPMAEFVAGIDPALVVCGHENEMGHTIDHREAWWLTFRRMEGVRVPYVVMAWGEAFAQ